MHLIYDLCLISYFQPTKKEKYKTTTNPFFIMILFTSFHVYVSVDCSFNYHSAFQIFPRIDALMLFLQFRIIQSFRIFYPIHNMFFLHSAFRFIFIFSLFFQFIYDKINIHLKRCWKENKIRNIKRITIYTTNSQAGNFKLCCNHITNSITLAVEGTCKRDFILRKREYLWPKNCPLIPLSQYLYSLWSNFSKLERNVFLSKLKYLSSF